MVKGKTERKDFGNELSRMLGLKVKMKTKRQELRVMEVLSLWGKGLL